jgi:hypothetical protein
MPLRNNTQALSCQDHGILSSLWGSPGGPTLCRKIQSQISRVAEMPRASEPALGTRRRLK